MALFIFWAWIVIEHSTILPNIGRCSIVNETSPEANWNRRTGGQADRRTGEQDHVLSQAYALTKKCYELKINILGEGRVKGGEGG